MKKITLFFALMLGLGLVSLNAQTCQKSASSCSKKGASVSADGSQDAAAKLASLDASIEARECCKGGGVSYVRKDVDAQTGQAVFTSVEYNAEMGKFVNAETKSDKKAGCCAGKDGKSCSGKKATSADAGADAPQLVKQPVKGS